MRGKLKSEAWSLAICMWCYAVYHKPERASVLANVFHIQYSIGRLQKVQIHEERWVCGAQNEVIASVNFLSNR